MALRRPFLAAGIAGGACLMARAMLQAVALVAVATTGAATEPILLSKGEIKWRESFGDYEEHGLRAYAGQSPGEAIKAMLTLTRDEQLDATRFLTLWFDGSYTSVRISLSPDQGDTLRQFLDTYSRWEQRVRQDKTRAEKRIGALTAYSVSWYSGDASDSASGSHLLGAAFHSRSEDEHFLVLTTSQLESQVARTRTVKQKGLLFDSAKQVEYRNTLRSQSYYLNKRDVQLLRKAIDPSDIQTKGRLYEDLE